MRNQKNTLKNKFVFFMQKGLNIARATETKIKQKKCKQPRKSVVDELLNEEKVEIIKTESKSSDSDCTVVSRLT